MNFKYNKADFNISVDKPMRILHVMPQIGIGGAEKQLYELIVHTDTSFAIHEVLYYSDSKDEEGFKLYSEANISLTRVRRDKRCPLRFLRDFTQAVKQRNPDIVHCWLYSGNIWGRWAAILAGAKNIIVAYRSCSLRYVPIIRFLEMLTTRKVRYLANSQACANYISKKLGVDPTRFCVIYNGLDLQKFEMPTQRQTLFAGLHIPDDVKVVTMAGSLRAPKNYPMFFRVAREAKLQNLPLHFIVVGTGEMKDKLAELALSLKVQDRVHFIGIRNDIPEILRASDIFLFTSLYEGFPNALLEAMAARLPVVTTNFNGVDELVENGFNGIVVPINDVNAAFTALKFYIDNPQKARQFAAAARMSVEQRFPMEKMVDETLQFYRNLISRNSSVDR